MYLSIGFVISNKLISTEHSLEMKTKTSQTISAINLLLTLLSTQIQCQNKSESLPTQLSICADPKFDAALAVDDLNDSTVVRRFLFRGQHVMPYSFDSEPKTILWQNISRISDLFQSIPQSSADQSVKMAFEINGTVYLVLKANPTKFLSFTQEGQSFRFLREGDLGTQLGYIYLQWNVETIEPGVGTVTESFFFIDWRAPKSDVPPHQNQISMAGRANFTITGNFNLETMNPEEFSVSFSQELIPNILLINIGNTLTRVPVLFDTYYQTNFLETIFFRGHGACVSSFYALNIWEDSEYCRLYVNTRSIIGCLSSESAPVLGPEIDGNEAEDVAPDM